MGTVASLRIFRPVGAAAALLSLLVMCFATAQSSVMQAAMASGQPMPMCGSANVGASGPADQKSGPIKSDKTHKVCPICALAGSPLLAAQAIGFSTPTTISWVHWRPMAPLGPRAPPSLIVRARGPPISALNA